MAVEQWRGRESLRRYGHGFFMVVHEVRFRVIRKTVSFWQSLCTSRRVYPLQSCSVINVQKENFFCFVDLDGVNLLYEMLIF